MEDDAPAVGLDGDGEPFDDEGVAYEDEFWATADNNDFLERLISFCPQRVWLELNGDPDGLHFAPWLCVCSWLKIRFPRMKEILGRDWGNNFMKKCGALKKAGNRGGLGSGRIWIWLCRKGHDPPGNFGPGDDDAP